MKKVNNKELYDLNKSGYLVGNEYLEKILHIRIQNYVKKKCNRIRIINSKQLFGIIDIFPFELNEIDEVNLKTSLNQVTRGTNGIGMKDKQEHRDISIMEWPLDLRVRTKDFKYMMIKVV